MSIDTTNAGKQIAEQMEAIEKDYEDKEGFQLGAVVTIVEVAGPDCGAMRSFEFGPQHYPPDGHAEYCGGRPVWMEDPEHEGETHEVAKQSREQRGVIRRRGSDGDGR
jgi:hypothetical protein